MSDWQDEDAEDTTPKPGDWKRAHALLDGLRFVYIQLRDYPTEMREDRLAAVTKGEKKLAALISKFPEMADLDDRLANYRKAI